MIFALEIFLILENNTDIQDFGVFDKKIVPNTNCNKKAQPMPLFPVLSLQKVTIITI
jgi:hypothetical protein